MGEGEAAYEPPDSGFPDYPFDPPPSGLHEPDRPRRWPPSPVILVLVVAALGVAAVLVAVTRAGISREVASVEQTSSTSAGSTSTTVGSTTSTTTTMVTSTTEVPGGAEVDVSYPNPAAGSGAAGSGCDPATGPLPDGVWFGRMQQTLTAPEGGFWADDEVEFDAYCLYGGEAAVQLAASRLDEMRAGYDFYAINDVRLRRTIPRTADATARELLAMTGAVGPPMPWDQGFDRLGHITGMGCCTEAWVRIEGGVVVEIAVIMEGGLSYSFPRPRGAQCTDNGLEVNPLLMVVDSIPADSPTGELSLHADPGLGTRIVGTVPVGTLLNVVHRCEITADGFGWWMLDWDGRFVWGPGEFLRQYSRG